MQRQSHRRLSEPVFLRPMRPVRPQQLARCSDAKAHQCERVEHESRGSGTAEMLAAEEELTRERRVEAKSLLPESLPAAAASTGR
jgi:hypothetical protein